MSLKKSDKIIALIGVLIIVVAGIAIVYFAINQNEPKEPIKEVEKPIFNVMYELKSKTVNPDNTVFNVDDKLILKDVTYNGIVQIKGDNIVSVDFSVDFPDKNPLFIKDTLYISIKDSNGKEVGKGTLTGKDNVTIPVKIGEMISTESIEANTTEEAQQILENRYVPIDEKYSIEIYEVQKPIRLGKDSFTLKITEHYYEYYVEEETQSD